MRPLEGHGSERGPQRYRQRRLREREDLIPVIQNHAEGRAAAEVAAERVHGTRGGGTEMA